MAGGGGQQGAAAPAQGGANAFSGSTNPTPYQGSAAPQNLGQNLGQAPGAQESFAGQNQQTRMMTPLPAPAGAPYGGFNAQGQEAVNSAQANYTQSGGQGQLTQAQQAAIAQNANPQGGQTFYGVSQIGYTDPAMQAQQQAAMDWAQRMNAAQGQPQGQELYQNDIVRRTPMPQPQSQVPLAPYQGSQTPAAPTNYISSNAAPPGPPPDIMQYGAPPPPQGMPPQGMPPQGMPPQGMPPQGMPPQFQPQARQPLQIKKNMNIAAPQRHNIQVLGNPTATQYAPRGRRGVR